MIPVLLAAALAQAASAEDLARANLEVHRFSTLFTAHEVRSLLGTAEGRAAALDWCRKTAVTKVYVESFRDGYQVPDELLKAARDEFRRAGLEVSGCITPTRVGKVSTGWKIIACYTDEPTQARLQKAFEAAAGLFDEVMIDDFWFTDCACPECEAARKAKTAKVGEKTYPVAGDTWADYRCELLLRISLDRMLGPSRRVNPKVRLIIKYPQWYDRFHERGYDVVRETAEFDRIWVGTETRDYADARWGGTPQYEAYFIMRWLGGIGGAKCGGGWYDPYGTTERTYVEQARQTVLGGARESMLFCYGSLLKETGPKNVEALRANLADLFTAAREVSRREVVGVAAYKPPGSDAGKEPRVFDFVGMLGFPLVPCHEFPADAPAAFFSVHALKDPELVPRLQAFLAAGKPVLLTDGLADRLAGRVELKGLNVRILPVKGDPKSLLAKPPEDLDALREPLLKPLGVSFRAPARVGFYLFKDGSWVAENFSDDPASIEVGGKPFTVPPRDWLRTWKAP
jgi:hypothetical protein